MENYLDYVVHGHQAPKETPAVAHAIVTSAV
jgi:hypothetical protein